MSILDEIVSSAGLLVEERKKTKPLGEFINEIKKRSFELESALKPRDEISIIAEIKRSSPSKGILKRDVEPRFLAHEYEAGGASAISLITEERYFGGKIDDIDEVKAGSKLPVLRKDFVIDPYQIYESAYMGFSAVLLIVRVLGEGPLNDLLEVCGELGLDALVEVHSEPELATALTSGARIIGINNRDFRDFSIDLNTSLRLAPMIPKGVLRVSESGISSREDVKRMRDAGFDAVLVGEVLMRSNDPRMKLRQLLKQS